MSGASQDSLLMTAEQQTHPMDWKAVVAKYQQPSLPRSIFQIVNSVVPFAALWFIMDWALGVSGWLIPPLAILAGGFLARIFIIHHDCGHGSFFKSQTANDVVGFITGVLTFTPYHFWRFEHAVHHAGSGDLDRRDLGSVWTMTVQEYLDAPWWKRSAYRVMRNPAFLLGVAPLFLFLVYHRFASSRASRRDRYSVYWTNACMLAVGILLSLVMGVKAYLIIQISIIAVASTAGVWLFYVQHQFEGVNWQRHDTWDYATAAIEGSSFYKLPRILQWFSGNIGFHHVHHLSPRIPNYNLEKCHNEGAMFQRAKAVTFFSSFKSLSLRLWDESQNQLVGYGHLRTLRK